MNKGERILKKKKKKRDEILKIKCGD